MQKNNPTESDRFFIVSPDAEKDGVIVLNGSEFHHCVRVCRARSGDMVKLLDGCGGTYEARIERVGDDEAILAVTAFARASAPPPVDIALGVIKAPRFDIAVEKCTELGVRRIIPFTSERCAWREGREEGEAKVQRIRRKIVASCKQSGQAYFPEIDCIAPFDSLVARFPSYSAVFLADQHPDAGAAGGAPTQRSPVLGVVGPEGGLSPREREILVAKGAIRVTLGPCRLRSETAAICLLYRLMSDLHVS